MAVAFNGKIYNAEVFLSYVSDVPRTEFDQLLKAGVLEVHPELRAGLVDQTGGNFITRHYRGRVSPDNVQNYDGESDIAAETLGTYEQGVIVIGRDNAWAEYDFTYELSHTDFINLIAQRVAEYDEAVDERDLIAVLQGIEGIEGFENHVITTDSTIGATTINSAVQKACGDLKDGFAVFVCHSYVATQLENLNLLEYLKYTDAQGITRSLNIGTINGKICVIDDNCPYDAESGLYTSYILGKGAVDYCDVGVVVPAETQRDPAKNGGVNTLYHRWRKVYAPKGISFTKNTLATASPTAKELADSSNWELAKSADGKLVYPEKAIPICVLKTKAE